jgi:hypothetical protein
MREVHHLGDHATADDTNPEPFRHSQILSAGDSSLAIVSAIVSSATAVWHRRRQLSTFVWEV